MGKADRSARREARRSAAARERSGTRLSQDTEDFLRHYSRMPTPEGNYEGSETIRELAQEVIRLRAIVKELRGRIRDR